MDGDRLRVEFLPDLMTLLARIFARRFLLWMLGIVSIAVLVAFSAIVSRRQGQWEKTKALLAHEHETLVYHALLPAAIPEDRNFCALSPLRDIITPGDGPDGEWSKKRRALEAFATPAMVHQEWYSPNRAPRKGPASRTGGPAFARKIPLPSWISLARESGLAGKIPDSVNAPREVLMYLDQAQPLLKKLADAAATHPEALFLPAPKDRALPPLPYDLPKLHLNGVQAIASALRLRAALALDCDVEAALHSTLAIQRLTEACLKEPQAASCLTAASLHAIAQESVWNLLENRRLTEPHLLLLQGSLERLPFLAAQLQAMRGELIIAINGLDRMQSGPSPTEDFAAMLGVSKASLLPKVSRLTPLPSSALFDASKAAFARMAYEGYILPMKVEESRFSTFQTERKKLNDELGANSAPPLQPTYAFARLALRPLSSSMLAAFKAEAVQRQSVLACALERFHLQHHTYPAALTELVPAFIARNLNDPMDNQPMRYRQTQAGRYLLWSIAFDAQDDEGRVDLSLSESIEPGIQNKPQHTGDWVWQYEEIKAAAAPAASGQ